MGVYGCMSLSVCVCAGERERGGESVKEQEQARYDEVTRRRGDETTKREAKWRSGEVRSGKRRRKEPRGARCEAGKEDDGWRSSTSSSIRSSISSG